MRYRELGTTGIRVSEIGFGAWGIGGISAGPTSYGPTTDADSEKALWIAVEKGINYFDTANIYGDGHSETLIGRALGRERSNLVLSSKIGLRDFENRIDLTEGEMRASLEGSLRRLGTDYLDILFLHNVSLLEIEERPEIAKILREFQDEGKVRFIGVSLQNPADASNQTVLNNFSVIQVNFSLLDMRLLLNGFFALEGASRLGVVARTPFNFGFLSRNFPETITFPNYDHRSRWGPDQIGTWVKGANQVLKAAGLENLDDVQSRIDCAINFCLSFPAVSTVIPGMLTSAEVESNVAAVGAQLLTEEQRRSAISAYSLIERELRKYIRANEAKE